MLHGIHCTPSCCIKSTAFNRVPFLHTAGNTMHSIGMHFNTLHGLHCCIMDYTAAIMLHIIHCIQSGCFGPCCIKSTAFNRVPTLHAAWNPLHSIRMLWAMLNKFHCIQRHCMESTEFNWETLYKAVWPSVQWSRWLLSAPSSAPNSCLQGHQAEDIRVKGLRWQTGRISLYFI